MSSLVEVEPYALSVAEPGAHLAEQQENRRETNLLHLAWQSRWLLLFCMLIGLGLAWVVLQRVTPLFPAQSRIYVDRVLPAVMSSEMQLGQSANYVYTQAELIRSTPVLLAVAETEENKRLDTFRDIEDPVGFLRKNLSVTVGAKDDIINVYLELADAQDAAQIVNSVVEAYISRYAENRRSDTVEILNILRAEKQRRDTELEERRQALSDFRKQHTALAIQVDNENVITRRFAALAQELNQSEIELLEARARYNKVKAMYDKPSERLYLLEAASKERVGMRDMDLENQVRQIEQVLTTERAQWGEGHPKVRLLREQYVKLQKMLKDQQLAIVVAYVNDLRQTYEVLEHKRNELKASYDRQFKMATDVSSQALELNTLQDALDRTERLCDILDERIKEVNLTEEVGAMNVSILEPALVSTLPSYPVRSRFLASGLLAGGLIGFGLAWLRDLLDHRLKSVEEIASVLQLPVLGALPHFGDKQEKSQTGRLVALTPRSVAAESVRTLRTALHFGLAGHDAKVIVVTSPSPGDGKSTVTSNLAIAMAQADQRVLLIDADLRKPTQHLIFEVSAETGLGSVLTDRRPVDEAIVPSVLDSLDLLPCGPLPSNPVELLNNGFFAEMLDQLRERYDRIVIDSPPVMPVADARVIAALGDATVLVLRAERSTRRLSLAARNELWRVRATRIGVVVNGVPLRKQGHYGNAYGYGYGEYGYMTYGYGGDEMQTNGRSAKRKPLLSKQSPAEAVAPSVDSA
jgi:capsular exopolysaccharide synthesis family protein